MITHSNQDKVDMYDRRNDVLFIYWDPWAFVTLLALLFWYEIKSRQGKGTVVTSQKPQRFRCSGDAPPPRETPRRKSGSVAPNPSKYEHFPQIPAGPSGGRQGKRLPDNGRKGARNRGRRVPDADEPGHGCEWRASWPREGGGSSNRMWMRNMEVGGRKEIRHLKKKKKSDSKKNK